MGFGRKKAGRKRSGASLQMRRWEVPLQLKAFETLCVLVENAGRLLKKEALLGKVWPDTVVEENNLNKNVSLLRKALGRHANGQSYIETVPRVGYRFVARVTDIAATSDPQVAASGPTGSPLPRQDIRFSVTADGVRIAWASVGNGEAAPSRRRTQQSIRKG
jgi:DNA-binding winged helix-turn-helix (wHTH) protein